MALKEISTPGGIGWGIEDEEADPQIYIVARDGRTSQFHGYTWQEAQQIAVGIWDIAERVRIMRGEKP